MNGNYFSLLNEIRHISISDVIIEMTYMKEFDAKWETLQMP